MKKNSRCPRSIFLQDRVMILRAKRNSKGSVYFQLRYWIALHQDLQSCDEWVLSELSRALEVGTHGLGEGTGNICTKGEQLGFVMNIFVRSLMWTITIAFQYIEIG